MEKKSGLGRVLLVGSGMGPWRNGWARMRLGARRCFIGSGDEPWYVLDC